MNSKSKIALTFLFIILSITSFAQSGMPPTGVVRGTIKDAATDEDIIGAAVRIDGTTLGTMTDINGFFSISKVPVGKKKIIITYVSYKQKEIEVTVEADKVIEINTTLQEDNVVLQVVKVVANRITGTEVSVISEIKASQMIVSGISSAQIAMEVRTALFGSEIAKFRDDKDEYPIQLRIKATDRNQIEKLLGMKIVYRDMVMGGMLREVPLNSIATVSYSTTFSQINRKNQERVITLSSNVSQGYTANEIVPQIDELMKELNVPNGYVIRMGGEQEEQEETGKFLFGALIAAILLIFLVLATQFNSISKPLIIFVTILLSFIGLPIDQEKLVP